MKANMWAATAHLVVALGLPSAGLASQGPPGTNVVVFPSTSLVTMAQGITTITFTMANGVASAESLFIVTLDAPSAVTSIVTPAPDSHWIAVTSFRGRPVASWSALNTVPPGFSTPSLVYSAPGLPGIVTAWAEGYFTNPPIDDDASDTTDLPTPDIDPIQSASVQLLAVGVDPIAPGSTPATLTARLDSLRGQTCTLTWITSATLCTTLHGYLVAQPANLTQFNTDLSTGHTTGGPVNDNAYWLLKSNADYIISISPPPVNTALINLSYVCGNKFKVRNLNTVAVPLTWNVINGSETGAVTVPAKLPNGEPGSVFITTVEKRTLRLYYNGQLIATVANGNKPPC